MEKYNIGDRVICKKSHILDGVVIMEAFKEYPVISYYGSTELYSNSSYSGSAICIMYDYELNEINKISYVQDVHSYFKKYNRLPYILYLMDKTTNGFPSFYEYFFSKTEVRKLKLDKISNDRK